MNTHDSSRRRFLAQAVPAAVATFAFEAMASQAAPATAKLPKLPLDNPQAKALAYTENAATVKHPLHKAGDHCDDCNFYKGAPGQAYGPCQIFPQYSVAAHGWCSAWAKKV